MSGAALANAALIDNAAYTTDTLTKLDWLDLTETRGLSFDDVTSQMGNGQKFEGWGFASRTDVVQFWVDAGGDSPFTGVANGRNNWVGQLQSLWGKTYPFVYLVNGNAVQGTIAMTSDASSTCLSCNLTVYLLDNIDASNSSVGDYAEAIQLNEAFRWQGQGPIGHALIRATAPIPEPSGFQMLVFGLAAVIVWRGRRTVQKSSAA